MLFPVLNWTLRLTRTWRSVMGLARLPISVPKSSEKFRMSGPLVLACHLLDFGVHLADRLHSKIHQNTTSSTFHRWGWKNHGEVWNTKPGNQKFRTSVNSSRFQLVLQQLHPLPDLLTESPNNGSTFTSVSAWGMVFFPEAAKFACTLTRHPPTPPNSHTAQQGGHRTRPVTGKGVGLFVGPQSSAQEWGIGWPFFSHPKQTLLGKHSWEFPWMPTDDSKVEAQQSQWEIDVFQLSDLNANHFDA